MLDVSSSPCSDFLAHVLEPFPEPRDLWPCSAPVLRGDHLSGGSEVPEAEGKGQREPMSCWLEGLGRGSGGTGGAGLPSKAGFPHALSGQKL